jgi:hypothetical protein
VDFGWRGQSAGLRHRKDAEQQQAKRSPTQMHNSGAKDLHARQSSAYGRQKQAEFSKKNADFENNPTTNLWRGKASHRICRRID